MQKFCLKVLCVDNETVNYFASQGKLSFHQQNLSLVIKKYKI